MNDSKFQSGAYFSTLKHILQCINYNLKDFHVVIFEVRALVSVWRCRSDHRCLVTKHIISTINHHTDNTNIVHIAPKKSRSLKRKDQLKVTLLLMHVAWIRWGGSRVNSRQRVWLAQHREDIYKCTKHVQYPKDGYIMVMGGCSRWRDQYVVIEQLALWSN